MPLGVLRSGDRKRLAEVAGAPAFAGFKQKIQERDQHCCALCSFESKKYQDIAPKPGVATPRAAQLNADDWITVCQFCQQTLDVTIAAEMKSGVLIWMPELSQGDLNNLARAIYVARVSQGPLADAARKIMEALMKRRETCKQRTGTDDPALLVTVMSDFLEERHTDKAIAKLDGVRLFPLDRRIINEGGIDFNQFPQILAYWRSREGPFGHHLPGVWLEKYITAQQAA